jgi:hypothetical protein
VQYLQGKTHQNAKQIIIRKRNPKGLFIKTNQEEHCLLVVHKTEYFILLTKRAFLPGYSDLLIINVNALFLGRLCA